MSKSYSSPALGPALAAGAPALVGRPLALLEHPLRQRRHRLLGHDVLVDAADGRHGQRLRQPPSDRVLHRALVRQPSARLWIRGRCVRASPRPPVAHAPPPLHPPTFAQVRPDSREPHRVPHLLALLGPAGALVPGQRRHQRHAHRRLPPGPRPRPLPHRPRLERRRALLPAPRLLLHLRHGPRRGPPLRVRRRQRQVPLRLRRRRPVVVERPAGPRHGPGGQLRRLLCRRRRAAARAGRELPAGLLGDAHARVVPAEQRQRRVVRAARVEEHLLLRHQRRQHGRDRDDGAEVDRRGRRGRGQHQRPQCAPPRRFCRACVRVWASSAFCFLGDAADRPHKSHF